MSLLARSVALATTWDGEAQYRCAILHYCQHAQAFADVLTRDAGVKNVEMWMLLVGHNDALSGAADMKETDVDTEPWRKVRDARFAKLTGKQRKRKFCIKTFCTKSRPRVLGERRLNVSDARLAVQEECPQMHIARVEPRLRAAVAAFSRTGCRVPWTRLMMYKWWAASLSHVSIVVFADLDLQLMRPDQPPSEVAARWRQTWEYAVPATRRPRLLSVSDYTSPLNGGLWTLAWPSRRLYEKGLELMRNTSWSATQGFNAIGTPRAIFNRLPHVRRRMRRTQMLKHNTWQFFNGDCDQGFLFYLFYLIPSIVDGGVASTAEGGAVQQAPTRASSEGATAQQVVDWPLSAPSGAEAYIGADHESYHDDYNTSATPVHSARHYWGSPKPWMLSKHNNEARVAYFLAHTNYSGTSRCAHDFASLAAVVRGLGVTAPRKPPKWSGKLQQLR